MQNFVWQIDVVGNQTIQTKQIEDLAKSLGLHTGAYLHNINFKQIQREMELQLPNIAWITVNHNKTKVVIELCESTKIPDMEGEDTPSNLVAKKDGKTGAIDENGIVIVSPSSLANSFSA